MPRDNMFGPKNATVSNSTINSFLCPSDPQMGQTIIGGTEKSKNSYEASLGVTDAIDASGALNAVGRDTTGLFAFYICHGIRDCLDGTSNTVAFAEAIAGSPVGGSALSVMYRGNNVMNVSGQTTANPLDDGNSNVNGVLKDLATCSANFTPGNLAGTRGIRWDQGAGGETLFNHFQTPNDAVYRGNGCRFGTNKAWLDNGFSMPASSWHSGGVNALFADGSVKLIKDSINRMTWWSLGTRAGGEIVSSDSY